jgi:hypothetical protein
MVEHYLAKVEVLPTQEHGAHQWHFLAIESVLRDTNTNDLSYQRVLQLLRSAGARMFRLWSQSRVLLLVTLLLSISGVALLGTWLFNVGNPSRITIAVNGWIIIAGMLVGAGLALPWFREHAGRISIGLLSLVLWIPAQLHILLIDRVFLWMGRLARLR